MKWNCIMAHFFSQNINQNRPKNAYFIALVHCDTDCVTSHFWSIHCFRYTLYYSAEKENDENKKRATIITTCYYTRPKQ